MCCAKTCPSEGIQPDSASALFNSSAPQSAQTTCISHAVHTDAHFVLSPNCFVPLSEAFFGTLTRHITHVSSVMDGTLNRSVRYLLFTYSEYGAYQIMHSLKTISESDHQVWG